MQGTIVKKSDLYLCPKYFLHNSLRFKKIDIVVLNFPAPL